MSFRPVTTPSISPFISVGERIARGEIRSKAELGKAKYELVKQHRLPQMPSDADILAELPPDLREAARPLLRRKTVRSISGVAVVAVMTSPAACPHGRCTYCPGGPSRNTPQAYTGHEPAAMRGRQYDYDPFRQAEGRLHQLHSIGHDTDKVDVIVMGGTFTSRPLAYQESFVKGVFDALNGAVAPDLAEAQRRNETAPSRCIGMTVETRPDWCGAEQLDRALRFGFTRVEMGVQTLNDGVLQAVRRAHTVADAVMASWMARNAGLKIGYHMMPGMPGTTLAEDQDGFRRLFDEEQFRPDMLKIYPTLVIGGTELYKDWEAGRYVPPSTESIAAMLAEVKRDLPPWVRIQRIQRDIPAPLIDAGVRNGNLREMIQVIMRERGWHCRCIRCREAGHRARKGVTMGATTLQRRVYRSSGGTEVFLSLEDEAETMAGYLRLRVPDVSWRSEITGGVVRELKVVGRVAPFAHLEAESLQHRGLGGQLLAEAERTVVEEFGRETMAVTSGVGARGYYRKNGYNLLGPYMVKRLGA